ncbi:hypothetical protein HYV91_01620 [Candidatus Wolfebacteria bacterium]|nr:hypothetical protein [Candidatus Wolfebacteria bacterium]
MYKGVILPAGLLAATIIGAGIFALPYVFDKAGLGAGLFYLTLFSWVFSLIHLMYADVVLRTRGDHRFAGYAEIYLGSAGKWISGLVTILGEIFILTIYLVLSLSFFNLLAPTQNSLYLILLFWFLGSIPIFWGIKKIAVSEFLLVSIILIIIFLIFFYGWGNLSKASFEPVLNFSFLFLPYGAILFALNGRTAIPGLVDYFRKNNLGILKVKRAVILGTLVPAFFYFLFVLGILGISPEVSPDSITGTSKNLPPMLLSFVGILGLLSLWSTYFIIGQDIKKSLGLDLRFNKIFAAMVPLFLPLFFYFSGFQNFLKLVELTGAVFLGLEGFLIILIWLKARRVVAETEDAIFLKLNPLVPYLLLLIFGMGIILELIKQLS